MAFIKIDSTTLTRVNCIVHLTNTLLVSPLYDATQLTEMLGSIDSRLEGAVGENIFLALYNGVDIILSEQ